MQPQSRIELYMGAKLRHEAILRKAQEQGWTNYAKAADAARYPATTDPELDACIRDYRQAVEFCEKDDAFQDAAVALVQIGMIENLRGRTTAAIPPLTHAREIIDSLPTISLAQQQLESSCLFHLGIALALAGERETGRRYLDRSCTRT